MPLNRRRALGLLTVVLGACATGDNTTGLSTGFASADGSSEGTGTSTEGTESGTGTDSYGTEGGEGAMGDDGYFEQERSAKDVDLRR